MSHAEKTTGTLSLAGRGELRVKPDIARINLAVQTQSPTAAQASQENAALMDRVIARMVKLEIPSGDIQTVGLNLSPVQSDKEPYPIVGYRAEDTVQITAPIALAARVFDEGITAGANESSSLSFGIRDPGAYREQLLLAAVKQARREAEVVSHAMGVTLHGVRSIDIVSTESGYREKLALSGPSTPVMPGQVTLSAAVQVVFVCG